MTAPTRITAPAIWVSIVVAIETTASAAGVIDASLTSEPGTLVTMSERNRKTTNPATPREADRHERAPARPAGATSMVTTYSSGTRMYRAMASPLSPWPMSWTSLICLAWRITRVAGAGGSLAPRSAEMPSRDATSLRIVPRLSETLPSLTDTALLPPLTTATSCSAAARLTVRQAFWTRGRDRASSVPWTRRCAAPRPAARPAGPVAEAGPRRSCRLH